MPSIRIQRAAAIAGSALFLVIAPGTLALYVPWALGGWQMAPPPLGVVPLRWLGVFLIAVGAPVLLDSFARFAWQGLGTPAPIAPPQHLVITGLYRYVRNPMYVAVTSLIFGQGLLFGHADVLAYGLVLWLGFHIFVLVYEEPVLRDNFGDAYKEFCANVRRWWPRLRPWRGTRNIAKHQEHRTES